MGRWLNPGDFVRGLLYPLRGLAILRRHGGLKRYWLPPIALTFAALVASSILVLNYHDALLALLWREPEGDGLATQLLLGLYWLARALTSLIGIALSLVGCIALASVLAAPFNDALSEVVEELETGNPALPFSLPRVLRDIGRSVRIELIKLAVYVGVLGPLLVASWILPGIGQLAYAAFAALFTVLYLAIDYVDWPASRRGYGLRQRLSLLTVRPMTSLGFGAAVSVCLFVPLLNLFFMPLAVAGGTRLFLDLSEYAAREP